MKLVRRTYSPLGVFGELYDSAGNKICDTLEHAYEADQPKLNQGEHLCVRGQHQLHSSSQPFETFEITSVPGHTGILFHVGNTSSDTSGCVLLGLSTGTRLVESGVTFRAFMERLDGINTFVLEVYR